MYWNFKIEELCGAPANQQIVHNDQGYEIGNDEGIAGKQYFTVTSLLDRLDNQDQEERAVASDAFDNFIDWMAQFDEFFD